MLIRITNTPRPYAWGSPTAIAELFGREATGEPEAELWFGSHPGAPARILAGAVEPDLERWATANLPDGRLPFLLKVLAAAEPLSLQVHPSAAQARIGFDRENAAGVPLDDPTRNYRDPFPKPEIIVAVRDGFRALCGFRAPSESFRDLAALHDSRLDPLLERLADPVDLASVLAWLLRGGPEIDDVIDALTARAAATLDDAPWLATVRVLADRYPGDPGVAISTLMNTVILASGEALWLPAGNLHAYVHGLGIELMTASDNVLRGGLTPKHVDVEELLSIVDARPLPAPLLKPEHPTPGVVRYAPSGAGFALLDVRTAELHEAELDVPAPSIVLCVEGAVSISGETLERGEAALVSESSLVMSGVGRVVVASAAP